LQSNGCISKVPDCSLVTCALQVTGSHSGTRDVWASVPHHEGRSPAQLPADAVPRRSVRALGRLTATGTVRRGAHHVRASASPFLGYGTVQEQVRKGRHRRGPPFTCRRRLRSPFRRRVHLARPFLGSFACPQVARDPALAACAPVPPWIVPRRSPRGRSSAARSEETINSLRVGWAQYSMATVACCRMLSGRRVEQGSPGRLAFACPV
jgi:hypothetical protein